MKLAYYPFCWCVALNIFSVLSVGSAGGAVGEVEEEAVAEHVLVLVSI